MKNKLVIVFASVITLFIISLLTVFFILFYEPTPDKHEVEEMVYAGNLTEFGEVEGSFLLSPRNYGFYNDDSIYIVEQYMDKGDEYRNQYVVIEEGAELTDDDEQAISQVKANYDLQSQFIDGLEVLSKHRMSVYKDDEKVEEEWLFKISYKYEENSFLSFLLPESTGEDRFNFFTEGYEQFLEF